MRPTIGLTGWLQPVLNKERLRIASPVLKLLLYEPRCRIETPLLWLTEIWLFPQGRKLKEETTFGPDDVAVPIGHEETTPVVAVHLELKTPGRSAGAGSRGYGPDTCYHRALMLAAPMKPTIAAAVHRYNF